MGRSPLTACMLAAAGLGSLSAVEIQQTLYGEASIEGIFQNRYLHGDRLPANPHTLPSGQAVDYYRDHRNHTWIRAKLGARIKIEDRVEANVSVVYDGEYADGIRFAPSSREDIHLGDANVLLRHLLFDNLHLRAGRQPVSWNLRRGQGAFLHDSRANSPAVTSWDGVRLHYNWDNLTFSPYHFNLNAARDARIDGYRGQDPVSRSNNSLTGIHMDWQPEGTGDGRVFVTGSISQERNLLVAEQQLGRDAVFADKLWNYYLGLEWEFAGGLTFFGEGAIQEGRMTDGQKMRGFGYSLGLEWDVGGQNNATIGIQYDHRSGDSNPNDSSFKNFVAPWEGVSDTLIVEHERYGELSNLLVGNLTAFKARAEYRFDHLNAARPFHLKFIWGYYTIDKPGSGRASHFGNEFDLTVSWQYNRFTSLDFFGGIFLPGLGYRQTAQAAYAYTQPTPDKNITLLGMNLNVSF